MSGDKRLTEVLNSAKVIDFDDSSKLILFSDIHRGNNSWADDFAHNQVILFRALEWYYDEGFTYIEVGDVDELWENRDFADIRRAHSHVFWMMRRFYEGDRLHIIYGNHDAERQNPKVVEATLYRYYHERTGQYEPLFEGITVHEGLVLRYTASGPAVGKKILLAHGHQVDPINSRWWRVSRLFVRHLWRYLQLMGIRDPTSPANSFKKRDIIEEWITEWITANLQPIIVGHTHRARFPDEGGAPYFNAGSCVHPRCITGIEIHNGEIALVKWSIRPNESGLLYVARDVLAGPKSLRPFLLWRPPSPGPLHPQGLSDGSGRSREVVGWL